MRFHLLSPDVKCPACGADLIFVRVRQFGDLYQCTYAGRCRCQVMHYRNKATKTCGWALISAHGGLGEWTTCGETRVVKGG
jgi:ssDNA-binding Zn-finger/Zn-ribbon topoisomerase 1